MQYQRIQAYYLFKCWIYFIWLAPDLFSLLVYSYGWSDYVYYILNLIGIQGLGLVLLNPRYLFYSFIVLKPSSGQVGITSRQMMSLC